MRLDINQRPRSPNNQESAMTRRIRWREKPCEICGLYITTNGLGRDAHMKWCRTATPEMRAALAEHKAKEERK